MTRHELQTRYPNASESFLKQNSSDGALSHSEPQCHEAPALGGNSLRPVWTNSEDTVLKLFYQNHPIGKEFIVAPLAHVLKRSEAAIHCRASELGVTFRRGKRPRKPPKTYESQAKYTREERSALRSKQMKARHANSVHPMLGKEVPQEVRDKISIANKGRVVSPGTVLASLKTKLKNGTLYQPRYKTTWKAGWRQIGNQRIYARSRWEANYARYLNFLMAHEHIESWKHEAETFWFEDIKRGARSYLPDFKVNFHSGCFEYHEVKGWMDQRSATKIRRMRIYHPHIVLRVIGKEWFKKNTRLLMGLIPDWESTPD